MKSESTQDFINKKGSNTISAFNRWNCSWSLWKSIPQPLSGSSVKKKQLLIHWIPHKTHVFAWSLCDSERLFVHASLGSEATIFWLLPHAFHSTGFTCKLGQYQINDEQKLNDFQDSRRQDLKILRLAIAPISLNWLFVDASFPVNYFHPVVLLIQDRLRTLTGNQASPVNFGLSSCNFETHLVYICPLPASSMLWSKDAEVLTGQPWIWTCQQPSVFFPHQSWQPRMKLPLCIDIHIICSRNIQECPYA